ncbi:MAG: DegQ family serine endoprotease [Proteobacteria bacterium]|nr:DegQ family serine endoprotease [Pseudomonadota bacterium]MBU1717187.1 DegQ family serine endoprotease [Pseudomonadota bacterium]
MYANQKRTLHPLNRLIPFVLLLAILSFPGISRAASSIPGSFADLAEDLGPTVVNIYTTQVVKNQALPFNHGQEIPDIFKRFFDFQMPPGYEPEQEQKRTSLGSGVINSADGYILTNNHVVENADEINVRLTNFEEYEAKIIGRDPKTDLALIKIEPKTPLPFATFGDSDKLRVGDWVIAIGNPFGFESTVTAGIVSGKGRSIGGGPYENFIQTDASINMGNSGGPLFDTNGKLVGINSMIYSRSGGNIGLGFAIPAKMAQNVIEQLKEHGKVTRGWLGVMIQHVSAELAEQFGLKRPIGALVGEVMADSPADKAGIKQGDVIIEYMGKEITKMSLLPSLVAQTEVGVKADLVLIRKGNKKEVTVKIGKLEEDEVSSDNEISSIKGKKLGITVQELTPELAQTLDLEEKDGILITNVEPNTPAADAGLRRGDLILQINQEPIKDLKSYNELLDKIKPKDNMLFLIKRDTHHSFVVVKNK